MSDLDKFKEITNYIVEMVMGTKEEPDVSEEENGIDDNYPPLNTIPYMKLKKIAMSNGMSFKDTCVNREKLIEKIMNL